MENNDVKNTHEIIPEPISKYYHEAMMAAMERANKRLAIIIMVVLVMFFATNAAWLWAWMQYDYTSEETIVDVDSGDSGNANYIGNNGDIYNGTSNGN